jgi:hypothetical protein
VVLAVQRLQALARDVRVDLRGGDVGVAEQQLHHAQVGAVVDEVRGERVAQRVRRDGARDARLRAWRFTRPQNAWRVIGRRAR